MADSGGGTGGLSDRQPAETADKHHRNVMIIATLAVAVLLIAMVWVVQLVIAQQKLERCRATGRRDCLQIAVPPRNEDTNPQR